MLYFQKPDVFTEEQRVLAYIVQPPTGLRVTLRSGSPLWPATLHREGGLRRQPVLELRCGTVDTAHDLVAGCDKLLVEQTASTRALGNSGQPPQPSWAACTAEWKMLIPCCRTCCLLHARQQSMARGLPFRGDVQHLRQPHVPLTFHVVAATNGAVTPPPSVRRCEAFCSRPCKELNGNSLQQECGACPAGYACRGVRDS